MASLCVALVFRRLSRIYWLPQDRDSEAIGKILRYIAPLVPGLIFLSIQGQLTVFIVSYFGVAKPVAEVAALGRLGQIFTLLAAFNGMILGPRFARMEQRFLKRSYLRTAGLVSLVALGASSLALFWPASFLWLLGPKYAKLSGALRYVTSAGCLGYISSALWSIHAARQWIYWWSCWYFIGIITIVQVLGIAFLPVSTTLGASILGFCTALAGLSVHIAVGIYSLKKDANRPRIPEADQPAPQSDAAAPAQTVAVEVEL
jgi:O-antigen/teichoic acid export membrane protein